MEAALAFPPSGAQVRTGAASPSTPTTNTTGHRFAPTACRCLLLALSELEQLLYSARYDGDLREGSRRKGC